MEATRVSIDELLGLEPVRLADEQVLTSLEAVERTRRRLEAQRLALIAQVEQRGLALEQGATSTAGFVRARLGAGPRESARLVRLATDVAAEPAARTALATGEVSAEHAQVIVRTLGGLPASVPSDVRGRAETLLLEWARAFDAEAMSRLARRLRSRIADEWRRVTTSLTPKSART